MCTPPLFAPPQRMAEPIPFLPPFFPPPEISSFWGTSIAITPSGTQEVLPTPAGRKYSTGSSLLTSSPSMTLTHPLFSIAPLAVAPFLTSPLLPHLLPFLAPGRYSRTWVLTIYQFFYLSLSFRSIAPTSAPLPSIFRKLAGMALSSTLTLTVLQQRNTGVFLFSLLLLSLPLWLWMRPNLPFLLAASNALLNPGGLLRWNKRLVKDARPLVPLTEVMKIDRHTSPFLDVPRQSLPRPRLRHGRRLALLFHLGLTLNLCTLFFALLLALLPRLFPLLTSLTVLLPGNRLRSLPVTWDPTFPFLSQRPCVAEPEATSLSSAEPRALWSLTRPLLSFFSLWIFAAASNLSSFTATGPDKVAYPMLKHLPRSGMDLLLHIFNLSCSSHSFPSIWMTSSIIPIHMMGKPLDSLGSFRPISLTSCVSKLFERIILSRLLFFLESNSIFSPRQAGFRPGRSGLHSIKFCTFLSRFRMGLTNPGRALGRFYLLSISLKLLTLSGIPPFSTNSFRLASLLALLVGLNLSFLIGALVWFFKITKVVRFVSVEMFRKNPFLSLYFSLSIHQRSSCLSAFFRQLLSLRWRSGHLILFPLGPHCGGGHTRSSVSIGALV